MFLGPKGWPFFSYVFQNLDTDGYMSRYIYMGIGPLGIHMTSPHTWIGLDVLLHPDQLTISNQLLEIGITFLLNVT